MKMFKAYAVQETDELTGGIVWANHAVVARRLGASQFSDGDFSSVSCRRAPWADGYAETHLPASVMIENGWHFECSNCGEQIDVDWLYDHDMMVADVIGTQHSMVFCCQGCKDHHDEYERQRKAAQDSMLDVLRQMVHRRFPDVAFCAGYFQEHAYATKRGDGPWLVEQAAVSFTWPGQKIGPASLRLERPYHSQQMGPTKPQFWCAAGDKDAFEAFAQACEVANGGSHEDHG